MCVKEMQVKPYTMGDMEQEMFPWQILCVHKQYDRYLVGLSKQDTVLSLFIQLPSHTLSPLVAEGILHTLSCHLALFTVTHTPSFHHCSRKSLGAGAREAGNEAASYQHWLPRAPWGVVQY